MPAKKKSVDLTTGIRHGKVKKSERSAKGGGKRTHQAAQGSAATVEEHGRERSAVSPISVSDVTVETGSRPASNNKVRPAPPGENTKQQQREITKIQEEIAKKKEESKHIELLVKDREAHLVSLRYRSIADDKTEDRSKDEAVQFRKSYDALYNKQWPAITSSLKIPIKYSQQFLHELLQTCHNACASFIDRVSRGVSYDVTHPVELKEGKPGSSQKPQPLVESQSCRPLPSNVHVAIKSYLLSKEINTDSMKQSVIVDWFKYLNNSAKLKLSPKDKPRDLNKFVANMLKLAWKFHNLPLPTLAESNRADDDTRAPNVAPENVVSYDDEPMDCTTSTIHVAPAASTSHGGTEAAESVDRARDQDRFRDERQSVRE